MHRVGDHQDHRPARLPALPARRLALAAVVAAAALTSGCADDTSGPCQGICPTSEIAHLVVIVQENHTFDSYFGQWCTAPSGSEPTCTDGPGCCERAPDSDPKGNAPVTLDDASNGSYDPNHETPCETLEIDGGKMDRFVDNPLCGDARNVAYAGAATVQPYWDLAAAGALADRWFQPVVGASAGNNMFLFDAAFVFADDVLEPDFPGFYCSSTTTPPVAFDDDSHTIGALLQAASVSWTFYAEGYAAMIDAPPGQCPTAPDACLFGLSIYPCVFEPNDLPVTYYPQLAYQSAHLRDYVSFAADIQHGLLPQVAFVKGLGYHTEHPGLRTNISDGIDFVQSTIDAIAQSGYASNTLVLVVYDEGGGYFDHVAPPPSPDTHPYGTRVPAIAVGPFARKGTVSHVQLEHSSIVKFIEWNWLRGDMGPTTGQLGARDAVVANIGSLLDPALGVPQD